jgi:hypothetical protein
MKWITDVAVASDNIMTTSPMLIRGKESAWRAFMLICAIEFAFRNHRVGIKSLKNAKE